MRILLTTDTIGGVWTFTQELATGLLTRGHCVFLLALGRPASAEQQAWCAAVEAQHSGFDVLCEPVPLEWMDDNTAAFTRGARSLLRIAEQFRPDLLHASQFCFGALATDFPRLVTGHSDVLSWARACRPAGLEATPWLARYVDMVEAGLRGADALAAPTHWMLRTLREHYPQLPTRQHVVPNGRTLPPFTFAQKRKQQAVSVGRLWDEGKNVRMLADVHSPWPLLIAGDQHFDDAFAPALPGQVEFLGALAPAELAALFSESSAYICTSVYEPFGLAPLEAAQCGCALLLNDLSSLREIWGDAALYFRDARELSALLNRLHHSPGRLRDAQQRAERRASHFTAGRMVEAYLALYEDLLRSADAATEKELGYDAA